LPTTTEDMQPTNTVYFDSSHPIYRRELEVYHSKAGGRTIQWVDVSLKESEVLISADLSRAILKKRFHARQSYDRVVSNLTAFMTVRQYTPEFRWLARFAALRPISALLSILHEICLKFRELKKHLILDPLRASSMGPGCVKTQKNCSQRKFCLIAQFKIFMKSIA